MKKKKVWFRETYFLQLWKKIDGLQVSWIYGMKSQIIQNMEVETESNIKKWKEESEVQYKTRLNEERVFRSYKDWKEKRQFK